MDTDIEKVILGNLIHNNEFARKSLPYLKPEYFEDRCERTVYKLIHKYFETFNELPSKEALAIDLESVKGINDDEHKEVKSIIKSLSKSKNNEWLEKHAEKFCKDRAIYLALMESIDIATEIGRAHV